MTDRIAEMTEELLSLPAADRVRVVQRLWESLDPAEIPPALDPALLDEILRRDEELSSGEVQGLTREEVMENLRRAI